LQLGQYDEATQLMDACYARATNPDATPGELGYFAEMRGLHIIDADPKTLTQTWDVAEDHPLATWSAKTNQKGVFAYQFLNAYRAIEESRLDEASEIASRLPVDDDHSRVYRMELDGLIGIAQGNTDAGLASLRSAAESEASLPFEFGPPGIIKPTYELLGEKLLQLGHLDEAREALNTAASRTPNRANVVRALALLDQPR
jgi:tetratricopeptide (TPR) repeat protein